MTQDFFGNLGKAVAAELAQPTGRFGTDPDRRQHLSNLMSTTLANHLKPPPGAQDAAFRSRCTARDQDPEEPVSLNSDDLMTLVRKCLDGLDGDERDAFMEQLANMFQSEGDPDSDNNSATNANAMDKRRRRGGRDQMPPPSPMPMDRRRRGAMDGQIRGMNTANFLKRWPDAAKIAFGHLR